MGRILISKWLWLTVYLAMIVGVAGYVIHLHDQMLSDDAENTREQQSWEAWREAASKQDGSTGPVQRMVPKSAEPPMLLMMRDNFPVILGASVVFPGIILGFLMMILHGVLRESLNRKNIETAEARDGDRV